MSFSAPIEFVKHGWSASQGLVVRTVGGTDWAFADLCGVIPSGTISDGASVPRVFWGIFSPFDGDYFDAAVLHDSIYRNRDSRITRAQADAVFLAAMEHLGVGFFKRRTVYRAVRMFGGSTWNQYRRNP
jgi:hypothetical protein